MYKIGQDMEMENGGVVLPYSELTSTIIGACFEVANELGVGFLESVYKNALTVLLHQAGLNIEVEQTFQVMFRNQIIGVYKADLVVEKSVLIELKSCKTLLPEHQAQTINYLRASGIPVGLLVNFGTKRIEYKRLHHPTSHPALSCTSC